MANIDHETLKLFAEESSLRLDRISADLELLANQPDNMEVIHSLFRETHSLKSAANLLALRPVEQIAHKLEDILESIRNGLEAPDEQLMDILYVGYARIGLLLHNPQVLQLIDAGKDVAAIDDHLRARQKNKHMRDAI